MSKSKAYQNRLEELFSSAETVQPEPSIPVQAMDGEGGLEYAYTDTATAIDRDLLKVVELGRTLSRVRDLDTLLKLAAQAIYTEFQLYCVQIHLADDERRMLRLQAAAGTSGEELLLRGYQTPIGSRSLIGIALTTEQPVAVLDSHSSDLYTPNPLLPNTSTILVLPIMASHRAFGALEMHFSSPKDLTPHRQTILEILAGRLAAAIENLRMTIGVDSIPEAQDSFAQSQTRAGWDDYLDAITRREHIGYRYDSLDNETITELVTPLTPQDDTTATSLHTPLQISGEAIGFLRLERESPSDRRHLIPWLPEENNLVKAIADRITQHIENLRLLAQAEHYREEAEDAARRLTREGWEQYVTGATTPLTGYIYDLDQVKPLEEEDKTSLELDAFNTVTHDIKVRAESIGELAISDVGAENTLANSILDAVADRLSTHIENLRLLEETEHSRQQLDKRAAELETVARVSTAAATILSPNELLQSIVDLSKYSFNLYHAHVYLLNSSKDTLVLKAGAGKVGYRMVNEPHSIPLGREDALVVQAAHSRQGVLNNNLYADPAFRPHPMLPDVQSELAVPLVVGDQLLGVFDVLASVTDRFSADDMRTFTTLASQVAVALRNAELYAEQMAAVVRLRELDHLKNSFLANMSHELRTPLNSILGFAQVILEELDGPLTDDMTNDLGLIEKNGKHLLNLINEILDMAKIEAGRMNLSPEPTNLHDLLSDVVESTQSLLRDRSLYLAIQNEENADLTLMLDYTRMRQVFLNVIGNATKFTDQGGITVEIERLANKVQIHIRDSGIGIPPDKLEMVFEAFTQVDTSTTRKVGGTGLGLPISRRLVEMHGGRLWAESSGIAGEGSTFTVELPITPIGKI